MGTRVKGYVRHVVSHGKPVTQCSIMLMLMLMSVLSSLGLCPGVPVHRGNSLCTPLFTNLCLAVEHCWFFFIGSCEPVHEDRTLTSLCLCLCLVKTSLNVEPGTNVSNKGSQEGKPLQTTRNYCSRTKSWQGKQKPMPR